jgi:anti-anti-sigma factor
MSHLYCPRCRLSLAFRFPSLPVRYCPRCLGYHHIAVEMKDASGESAEDLLETDLRRFGSTIVIELAGEFDIGTAPIVERALERSEREADGIVLIDLGGLTFMDLTGLRVLLAAHTRLGDRLRILPGRGPVQRVFEITHTLSRLPFTDDIHTDAERPAPARPPSPRARVSRPVSAAPRRQFPGRPRTRAGSCE